MTLRRGVAVLLGVTVLAMVAAVAHDVDPGADPRSVAAASPPRRPTAASGVTPVAWAPTLQALDAARSRAFATADGARLTEVYAPGAPALRRDLAVLGRLAGAGLRARGLRLTTMQVAVDTSEPVAGGTPPRRVRLDVEDVMPPYDLVDRDGAVVEERSGRGRVRWTVTLERSGDGWRVYDVERE